MSNVFDANCWCKYVDERIADESDWGVAIFDIAKDNGGVLLDEGGLCLHQYFEMRRPFSKEIYQDWFERATLGGYVAFRDLSGQATLHKELTELGLPKSEHVYFRLAIHGGGKYIVSIDSDFFDPARKRAGVKVKEKLLENCNGPVCKHMKRRYGISVFSPRVYIDEHNVV